MKNKIFLWLMLPATLLLFLAGLKTGSSDISNAVMWNAFKAYSADNTLHYILLNLRMPRVLLAFLVGGALSLSGYLMQAMVNNPLADPYILGTASGASLGASMMYLLVPASLVPVFLPSFAAFIGAVGVTILAVVIATDKGHVNPSRLLLSGVALSSLTMAVISFFIFFSNDESKLKTIIFWSMGSFESARWPYIPLLAAVLFTAVFFFTVLYKQMNILLLGEARAQNLGLNVRKIRWGILLAASLLTGFAVATSGIIGFVGLMIPHFIRGYFGVASKYNALFITLLGGNYLMACDFLSKILYPPAGIPIGIITSFLGIPFFVYLLSKNNYRFN